MFGLLSLGAFQVSLAALAGFIAKFELLKDSVIGMFELYR